MQGTLNQNPNVQAQAPPPLPEPHQEELQEYRSELVKEYDEVQQQARVHEAKEQRAREAINAHEKYVDVVSNRSPKGKFPMTLVGRPIDVFKLEDYLIFNISPLTNITLMRYNEVKAWEDAQGYGRRSIVKKRKSSGYLIFMIIIIIIMIAVGAIFLIYGPQIMGMFTGMFGGY